MQYVGANFLGPQDFTWWLTMITNDHSLTSAGASLVRIPRVQDFSVGNVIDVVNNTTDTSNSNRMLGVVVALTDTDILAKLLGPVQVLWSKAPTKAGMLAVLDGAGGCDAKDAADIANYADVIGTALEVPSGALGYIALGYAGGRTQSKAIAAGSGSMRAACCVIDMQTGRVDQSYPVSGVMSVDRNPDGSLRVGFKAGLFSENPAVRCGYTGTEAIKPLVFGYPSYVTIQTRIRENIVTTARAGKLNLFAIGGGV